MFPVFSYSGTENGKIYLLFIMFVDSKCNFN